MTSADRPAPATAAEFRAALRWTFEAGEGLVIECRHLALEDLVFAGSIPLPILEKFATEYGGLTMAAVLEQPDAYQDMLTAARHYASLAAVAPRISLTPTDDPSVLVLSADPLTSDLPDSIIVALMNAGLTRRLRRDPRQARIFRPEPPAVPDVAGPDGAAVPDAAEPLAEPAG